MAPEQHLVTYPSSTTLWKSAETKAETAARHST